jgi:hypothetical protein
MGIPMAQIPDILLVPGQYQEIDSSLAGSAGEINSLAPRGEACCFLAVVRLRVSYPYNALKGGV